MAKRKTKRDHVLAAKAAFLKFGYAIPIKDLIREMKVSRRTIYGHFGSKEAIFLAVVDDIVTSGLSLGQIDFEGPLEEVLRSVGRVFVGAILNNENVGLSRIVVEQAREMPLLAATLQTGRNQAIAPLAAYFRTEIAAQRIAPVDAAAIAESFYAAVMGHTAWRTLYGDPPESLAARSAHIDAVAALYARGLQPG